MVLTAQLDHFVNAAARLLNGVFAEDDLFAAAVLTAVQHVDKGRCFHVFAEKTF